MLSPDPRRPNAPDDLSTLMRISAEGLMAFALEDAADAASLK